MKDDVNNGNKNISSLNFLVKNVSYLNPLIKNPKAEVHEVMFH